MDTQGRSLLARFSALHGLSFGSEALGLDFLVGGLRAIVMAHPRSDDRLMIEIQLPDSETIEGLPPARALLLLHQINETGRFEHDWIVTVSADLGVQLHRELLLGACEVADLEAALADGIERGEALARAWKELLTDTLAPDPSADGGPDRPGSLPALHLRG